MLCDRRAIASLLRKQDKWIVLVCWLLGLSTQSWNVLTINYGVRCKNRSRNTDTGYHGIRNKTPPLKHPKFPNSLRGVSKFFACGAIRLGGFQSFTEIHQFGLGGISTRGGFYSEYRGRDCAYRNDFFKVHEIHEIVLFFGESHRNSRNFLKPIPRY